MSLDNRYNPGDQPTRLAHLDDCDQCCILIECGEGSTHVVRLSHGAPIGWSLQRPRWHASQRAHSIYKRHRTTTLFAAIDILVIGRCLQRHRHQEFIRFLNAVEREIPAGKTVHAILDNYASHKHPKLIEWLGRHPIGRSPSRPPPPAGSTPSRASSPSSPDVVSSAAFSRASSIYRPPSTHRRLQPAVKPAMVLMADNGRYVGGAFVTFKAGKRQASGTAYKARQALHRRRDWRRKRPNGSSPAWSGW